jgi:hypothetical protein
VVITRFVQNRTLEQFQPDWNSLADNIATKYKALERATVSSQRENALAAAARNRWAFPAQII